MELARITKYAVDISSAAELFSYSYDGAAAREVMARINLGTVDGPIVGGGAYVLTPAINGVDISPVTTIQVASGTTRTVLISRPLPLEEGDVLTVTVSGAGGDTAVDAVISIRDVTPLRIDELTGSGPVSVDHDYGGTDTMTYRTAEGSGIGGAAIQVYLAADYAAKRRGNAFVVARSETGSDGRWIKEVMLSPGQYTAMFFRQGRYGPDTINFTVS